MAFGGYKFKGYKVVRSNLSTNTYANWCLLVHQARIKAFMESCTLSGAQWHFSKTNGALSFESYGNVIYRVANGNGEYHDYLSFFKYGDEELYYMIATLGEYYWKERGTPAIAESAVYQVCGGSTTAGRYKFAGYSSALSLTEFPDDGPFSLDAYPFSALPCTSQIATNNFNFYSGGVTEGSSNHMVSSYTTIYVGYATKGKDIITVSNRNKGSVESGDGFSSLCAPDDNFKLMKINFGHSTETTDFSAANTISLDAWSNECLTSTGARNCAYTSTNNSDYNCLAVVPSALPFIQAGGQHVPYGSIYLSTLNRSMSQINGDYMTVKGVVKNELVCSNSFSYETRTQQPGIGMPVMGGNLMCFCCCQKTPTANSEFTSQAIDRLNGGYQVPGGTGSGFSNPYPQMYVYPAVYVGWDPSNPNINDDASWPELALQ